MFAAASLPLQQNDPVLTLDEAIAIASKDAFAVRTAMVAAKKADDLMEQTKSTQGLSVNLSGAVSAINRRDAATFGGPLPDLTRTIQLAATQQIDISGALRLAIDATKLNKTAADLAVENERLVLRNFVRTKYFAVAQTQEMTKVADADVNAAVERLGKAKIRYENGAIPKFDVIRFETDLRRAKQVQVDANQNVALAKQDLNNLLGRPIDTPFAVQSFDEMPKTDWTAEQITTAALSKRPDIRRASTIVEALHKVRDREKKGNAPSLVVSAVHSENLDPSFGQARGQTIGTATVSVPLYDSGLTKNKVKSADRDIESAEIALEQIRLGASLEVRSALTRLRSAKESYEVALQGQELAAEALRLAQLRYDEGAGILVDVISAQAELVRAQTNVVNARYQLWTAYSGLQRAVGVDNIEQSIEAPAAPEVKK